MNFLAELKYKEPLHPQTDDLYGVPARLEVKKQDGSKIVFSFSTNIDVVKYDKDENILNQSIYTTTKKQRENILEIVEIIED